MSHSGETLHYQLPKYVGTDIINPLTDFNDANDAIDEALYNANTSAANAVETAEGAASTVGSYDERITQAQQAADNAIIQSDNTMDMIADEFDPLKQGGYAIGDIVIYQQKLYTFINPHTGAWDAGDVVQQPIGDAVKATIEQGKSDIAEETAEALAEIAGQTQKVTATQAMIAPPFDANKSGGYAEKDIVTYADKLYQFTSNHIGAWTGNDVVQIDVSSLLGDTSVAYSRTFASDTPVDTVWQDIMSHVDVSKFKLGKTVLVWEVDSHKTHILTDISNRALVFSAIPSQVTGVSFADYAVINTNNVYSINRLGTLIAPENGTTGEADNAEITADVQSAITTMRGTIEIYY